MRVSRAYSIRLNLPRIVEGLFHKILRKSELCPFDWRRLISWLLEARGPLASRGGIDCAGNKHARISQTTPSVYSSADKHEVTRSIRWGTMYTLFGKEFSANKTEGRFQNIGENTALCCRSSPDTLLTGTRFKHVQISILFSDVSQLGANS